MRIWHEQLIPKLCQKHLCAMWREGLGAYKIITENRTNLSYWKHPATQEFVKHPILLWDRLNKVRKEMLIRGYNPKEMPEIKNHFGIERMDNYKPWQTLEQQIEILKSKKCKCNL